MAAGTFEAVVIVLGVAAAGGLITWGVCTARMANRDPDLFEPREGWGDWPAVPAGLSRSTERSGAGGSDESADRLGTHTDDPRTDRGECK